MNSLQPLCESFTVFDNGTIFREKGGRGKLAKTTLFTETFFLLADVQSAHKYSGPPRLVLHRVSMAQGLYESAVRYAPCSASRTVAHGAKYVRGVVSGFYRIEDLSHFPCDPSNQDAGESRRPWWEGWDVCSVV